MKNRNNFNKTWISIITFMGIFLFSLGIVGSERLIPIIENLLSIKHWQSGTIISANLFGFLLSMLIGGLLSDLISRKLIITSGFIILSLGSTIFGYASGYRMLLLGNLLIGVSGGLLEGNLSLVIMDTFKEKKGMALNLSQVFFGLGAGLAPFLVILTGIWKKYYLAISLLSLATIILLFFQKVPDKIEENSNKNKSIIKTFSNLRFILTVAAMFFYSSTEMGIASWISSLFVKELKSPEIMGTLALSSYWTAQLIGRLTIGLNVDKIKSEILLSSLFIMTSISLTIALLLENPISIYILFTLSGVTMAPLWPTILSDARNHFTDFPGTSFGIIAAAGASAGIFIPPLIGRIADTYLIKIGLLITPATALIGGIIYIFLYCSNTKTKVKPFYSTIT